MKNCIGILIVLCAMTQFSTAQSNFGRRKFSRSLFSKNINIKSEKSDKKSTINTQKKELAETSSQTIAESSPVDSLPLLEISMTDIVLSTGTLDVNLPEELQIVTSNSEIREMPKDKPASLRPRIKQKMTSNSQLEGRTMKSIIDRNQPSIQDNRRIKSQDSSDFWDEFVEYLIYFGIVLLIVALVVGYVLLHGVFPIFATILGILVVIVGVFVLFGLALAALFDGFLSIFDR